MPDRANDILAYYNHPDCGESSRLVRHPLERDITLRYLADYLPASGRILEIGAAAGAYTAWLAQRGYHVTAVDLSETLIAQCRARISELGLSATVTCHVADARDLSSVPGTNFDAVLLMGPLYHLTRSESRLQALRQSVARLKPGGIFFSALISRLGILGTLLRDGPQWIENPDAVRSVIEHGRDPENTAPGGFPGYYATIEEIAPLHEEAGLQTLILAGAEPAVSAGDDSYARLEGTQRKLWLDLLYQISREPSMLASSRHMLYIGRK